MLAPPGGLFLDVKSAYSSAADLQLAVAALAGIGVHVKVCRAVGYLAHWTVWLIVSPNQTSNRMLLRLRRFTAA
jgi:hypothetical protein